MSLFAVVEEKSIALNCCEGEVYGMQNQKKKYIRFLKGQVIHGRRSREEEVEENTLFLIICCGGEAGTLFCYSLFVAVRDSNQLEARKKKIKKEKMVHSRGTKKRIKKDAVYLFTQKSFSLAVDEKI